MSAPKPGSGSAKQASNPIKIAVVIAAASVGVIFAIVMVAQFAIGNYAGRAIKDDPAMSPEAIAKRLKPVGELVIDPNAPGLSKSADAAPPASPPASSTVAAANAGGAQAAEQQAGSPAQGSVGATAASNQVAATTPEAKPVAAAPVAAQTQPADPAKTEKTAASGAGNSGKGKATYEAVCFVCHAAGVANAPKFADKAAWAPRIASGMDTLYHSVLNGKGAMPAKGGNASLAEADLKAAVDYMVSQAK
jgi:cytochrome c5